MATQKEKDLEQKKTWQIDCKKLKWSYELIVENYRKNLQNEERTFSITSPIVQLPVYPMMFISTSKFVHKSEEPSGATQVGIMLTGDDIPLGIGVEMYIHDSTNQKRVISKGTIAKFLEKELIAEDLNTLNLLMSFTELQKEYNLRKGPLTFHYDFTIFSEFTIKKRKPNVPALPDPDSGLVNVFKALFNDEKFSDVTLIVGETKFYAHKLILSVRSSVFAAMFTDKTKSTVEITDFSDRVIKALLRYIYSDEVEPAWYTNEEFVHAAYKYDLKNLLKPLCRRVLCENLNSKNAPARLMIADEFNVEEVKQRIVKFMFGSVEL
ncbi:protein roadkill [Diachasma alloeum]|uniref:protein roadkill n=1 Tax=Diachasma alloeum TaxID=454923 RepID=UPI0007384D51|nr:protein roadkill [Diachasma alloeum]